MVTFALCDGPLELFGKTPEMTEYDRFRKIYVEALTMLADADIPAVGYIDRPGSDPVLQMLDLLNTERNRKDRKSHGTDSLVFSHMLGPGARSAVFGLNSASNRELTEELRTCFFYMNIGRPGHP